MNAWLEYPLYRTVIGRGPGGVEEIGMMPAEGSLPQRVRVGRDYKTAREIAVNSDEAKELYPRLLGQAWDDSAGAFRYEVVSRAGL